MSEFGIGMATVARATVRVRIVPFHTYRAVEAMARTARSSE